MDRPAAIDRLAAMVLENESRATQVARLLHDHAGQTLTAIGLHLQALGGDPETTAQISRYLEQAIGNLRLACNKLQSNVVERSGVSMAIEMLAERLEREAGLGVELRLDVNQPLPSPLGHAVYRIVELALDNVVKHSGAASAEVRLAVTGDSLEASVEDFGRGFAIEETHSHPPGAGLILMELYARNTNLHLHIASIRRQGTIIRIKTI